MTTEKMIPLDSGFWTKPAGGNEEIQLIGSKCSSCEELFFPKKNKNWCTYCHKRTLEDILLSRKGKIATFSVVMQQPAGGFYHGEVPYSYGCIDLEDGIRIKSLISSDNYDSLKAGMNVELVIEKLWDDKDGNEISTFKFKPVA